MFFGVREGKGDMNVNELCDKFVDEFCDEFVKFKKESFNLCF